MILQFCIVSLLLTMVHSTDDSCFPSQYVQFKQKQSLTFQPIIADPYHNPSADYLAKVN